MEISIGGCSLESILNVQHAKYFLKENPNKRAITAACFTPAVGDLGIRERLVERTCSNPASMRRLLRPCWFHCTSHCHSNAVKIFAVMNRSGYLQLLFVPDDVDGVGLPEA